MVLDTLDNADRYAALHPLFAKGFEFLRRPDLAELEPGTYELDGRRLYVIITDEPGRGHGGAKRESHRDSIDIQYVLEGTDEIGWKPTTDCRLVAQEYDAAKDRTLYSDEPDTWLLVRPGQFVIFWPEDNHAPLGAAGPLLKAVVKVAVEA